MYKIIGADQKEYGPVNGDRLRQWILQNRANAQTLVKLEGSEEWKPLGEVAEFAAEFPERYSHSTAEEKSEKPDESDRVVNEVSLDHRLNIPRTLRSGLQLFFSQPLLLIGCTALAGIIMWITSQPKNLGFFINLIISGPLYGGLFYVFLRVLRCQPTGIHDLFIGFRKYFVPLVLAQLMVLFITMLSCVFTFAFTFVTLMSHKSALFYPFAILTIVSMLPPIHLSVCWFFTLIIVVDKGLDYWPAMQLSRERVHPQWILMAGLIIIAGMIGLSGSLIHQDAVVLTLPLFIAIVVGAYEDMFKSSFDEHA